MTEREKAFEKARKIYALVQEGIDGEKESARVAFERICRAHGFGEDDFNDEIIGEFEMQYKNQMDEAGRPDCGGVPGVLRFF